MSPFSNAVIKKRNAAKHARKVFLREERAAAAASVLVAAETAAISSTPSKHSARASNSASSVSSESKYDLANVKMVTPLPTTKRSNLPQKKTSITKHVPSLPRRMTQSQLKTPFISPSVDSGSINERKPTAILNSRPRKRVNKTAARTQRHFRIMDRSVRQSIRFVTKSAVCFIRNPNQPSAWSGVQKREAKLKACVTSLSRERKELREQMRLDENHIHLLNQKLLACNQPEDYRPTNEYPPEEESTATPLSGSDVRAFVKASLETLNKGVTAVDLENVLCALGLDKQGHMTNEAKKDLLAKGIRTLCDAHFGNYAEKEQAHILGELLFNSQVFAKEHSNNVSAKTTASVASCVYQLSGWVSERLGI